MVLGVDLQVTVIVWAEDQVYRVRIVLRVASISGKRMPGHMGVDCRWLCVILKLLRLIRENGASLCKRFDSRLAGSLVFIKKARVNYGQKK